MYLLFNLLCIQLAASDTVVKTNSGPVRGVSSALEDVDAFLAIPYAEPPVGDLRFAKPVPKAPWSDIYNASSLPPPCTQYTLEPYFFMPDTTNMSEDCLYLNLWAPKTESPRGLRPVIIFIHGGGFMTGSSNMKVYDGSKLASRGDLIVATINYRVGMLGFLMTDIEEAAGSMGMYDQVMAIKWIKHNAAIFGGNPDNIVLMGESAGAVSVSAHMISPLSKDLFQKAIMESGSIAHPYFYNPNVLIKRNSDMIASILGCSNINVTIENDPYSVVKCMKRKPKEDIVEIEKSVRIATPIPCVPRVNDDFLPKPTLDLFHEGKFRKEVKVLMGINRDEGPILLTTMMPEYFGFYGRTELPKMTKMRATSIMRLELSLTGESNPKPIIDAYFKRVKNGTSMEYTRLVADVLGDYIISCGSIFLANFLSLKGNPVYFYKFSFRPASTPMAEWAGTTHFEELQYVFGNPIHKNFTTEELELSNRLIDRWSAFARSGNPNIPGHMPWLRYSYHSPLYIDFGQEEESIRLNPLDRCEIWRKAFKADIDTPLIRFLRNSGTDFANVS